MSNSGAIPMEEIKEHIERMMHVHGSGHGFKAKVLNDDIMKLVRMVEEEQANYILDRIQDDYKESTKWVSKQLTEKE